MQQRRGGTLLYRCTCFLLSGRSVPPNMHTVHTPRSTARKTSCGIFIGDLPECGVIIWHVQKFILLYGCHITYPIKKEFAMYLVTKNLNRYCTRCGRDRVPKRTRNLRSWGWGLTQASFPARHLFSSFHSCRHLSVVSCIKSRKTL